MFNAEETKRYLRHISLPEIGIRGQEKLKNSSVLVIGAGGLGSPLLYYLAAAGVGKIGIVDHDVVDITNLQRQVLYATEDLNLPKAELAAERIRKLNPAIKILAEPVKFTTENALTLMKSYDLVVDGSDNLPARYLINDASEILQKPLVYGSVYRFEGQVSVFNYLDGPGYRDLFPEPPPPEFSPDCSTAGVVGVLPGIIGTLQANEVIKIILGIGEILSGKLLLVNALDLTFRKIKFSKDKTRNPVTVLIDYEHFCKQQQKTPIPLTMKEITVTELKEMIDKGEALQLIDVREPYEREIASIGGDLIPLNTITQNADKIATDKKVIFYCRSGKRSATAIQALQRQNENLTELYNLEGGILAWSDEIDDNVEKY